MSTNTNPENATIETPSNPRKLPGRPFQPGNKAAVLEDTNKRTRQLAKEAKKMARKPILEQFTHAFEVAIPRLVALLEDPGTSPREVIQATELLAGYILTKPKVVSEVTQTVSVSNIDPSKLTPEEIATMLALDNKLQGK
jgi:hypothetical protein